MFFTYSWGEPSRTHLAIRHNFTYKSTHGLKHSLQFWPMEHSWLWSHYTLTFTFINFHLLISLHEWVYITELQPQSQDAYTESHINSNMTLGQTVTLTCLCWVVTTIIKPLSNSARPNPSERNFKQGCQGGCYLKSQTVIVHLFFYYHFSMHDVFPVNL